MYTYAYDELEKLSGQLTLDTANRLSNFLTKRYLDYPTENGSDLNPPGFNALRSFVTHELNVSTSACSQVFCGLNDKGKSRIFGSGGRKNNHVCVRQVVLPEEPRLILLKIEYERWMERSTIMERSTMERSTSGLFKFKVPSCCFVCVITIKVGTFWLTVKFFKSFNPYQKRKTVVDANRCLNC